MSEQPLTDAQLTEKYGALWAEAEYAFRIDPGYVIALAREAAKAAAISNSRNSVRE